MFKKDKSVEEIEAMIADVNGTMAVEGMTLTEEDKAIFRKYLAGDLTRQELDREIMESAKREIEILRKEKSN